MKRWFLLILLGWCGLLTAGAADGEKTADEIFEEKFELLKEEYFRLLAGEVMKADRIEVYRFLDGEENRQKGLGTGIADPFGSEPKAVEWFPLVSSQSMIRVGKKIVLEGAGREEMAGKVSDMLIRPGRVIAACYDPHHGIRVFKGERIVLEIEICVSCLQFYLKYPEGPKSGIQMVPLAENGIGELLLKMLPLEK